MTQAFLPREIIKWLDSLDLTYSVRNVRRDLSNGFLIAEILSRSVKGVNIYSFDNGLKIEKKLDNWDQITKILGSQDFTLTKEEYEPIIHLAPEAAEKFLFRLYQFLTKKKLLNNKTRDAKIEKNIPTYAKPTASILSKNRELTRIVNIDDMKKKTENTITKHNEVMRQEKQNSNIIEYLLQKRKRQMEEELRNQALAMSKKKKDYPDYSTQDIKEIPVKSFTNNAKKKNEQQQSNEGREIMDFFARVINPILEKEPIDSEIKEIKIDEKISKIEFIFANCQEFSNKALKIILSTMNENLDGLAEAVGSTYSDFKKFFSILLPCLDVLGAGSKPFRRMAELLKILGLSLVNEDPQTTQIFFENIVLEKLVEIILRYPNKKEFLVPLIYSYCPSDSLSRLRIVKKIKEILSPNTNGFIGLLAQLVSMPYEDMDVELYDSFLYYSMLAIGFSSPITRTNGLKIINEICNINFKPVLNLIKRFESLLKDNWWEVKSQILIICSNLLLYLHEEQSIQQLKESKSQNLEDARSENKGSRNGKRNPSEGEEEDLGYQHILNEDFEKSGMSPNIKPEDTEISLEKKEQYKAFLINVIENIFEEYSSENILRIGLIYIAPTLNYYPELCNRYLEIILKISDPIRKDILTIDPKPEGLIVKGSNSFKYKLTGAPLVWNSVGIAKSLDLYVKEISLQEFDKEHLEILAGCLVNALEEKDSETWFEIYENLMDLIFRALSNQDLCAIASEILKKIFGFEQIQLNVLKTSVRIFFDVLSRIYHPDSNDYCKKNLLGFLDYLYQDADLFKEYIYGIIKDFSEKNKSAFLKSNLVEFMNNLSKERRVKRFPDHILN